MIRKEKCIQKGCKEIVEVDHSNDIEGFAITCGLCKKHIQSLSPPSQKEGVKT